MGIVACAAFWRPPPFRTAIVWVLALTLLVDAVGHIRQMPTSGNFAPGNAGSIFYWDIAAPSFALGLLFARGRASSRPARPDGEWLAKSPEGRRL